MTTNEKFEYLIGTLDRMLTQLQTREVDDLAGAREIVSELTRVDTSGWSPAQLARLESARKAIDVALVRQERTPRSVGAKVLDGLAAEAEAQTDDELGARWTSAGRRILDDPAEFARLFESMLVEFDDKPRLAPTLENWSNVAERMVRDKKLRRLLARRTVILELEDKNVS